jgi:hypothetical protein
VEVILCTVVMAVAIFLFGNVALIAMPALAGC